MCVCVCVLSPTACGELIAVLVSSSELLLSSPQGEVPIHSSSVEEHTKSIEHVNKTQY